MNQMTHSNNNPLDQLKGLAKIAASSGNYGTLSETVLLNLMLTAKDLGISPMKAINGGFHIIKGKVCMSTSLMADRIRKAGHSIKVPEWTSSKCVIIGIRRDNGDSMKLEYTIEDANQAGLTNTDTWKKFPKNMLYNRAMATLARTLFPDVVGCAYSECEKEDIKGTPMEERPCEDPVCVQSDVVSVQGSTEPMVERNVDLLDSDPFAVEPTDMTYSYHHDIEEALGDDEKLKATFLKLAKINKIEELDKAKAERGLSWIKKQKGLKMQGEEND